MFTNHSPRLRTHLRTLERERSQVERLLNNVAHDHDLQRTHADTLAALDNIDDEITELHHAIFLVSIERILLWLLPALAASTSALFALLR